MSTRFTRLAGTVCALWDLDDPARPVRLGQLPADRVSSVMFSLERVSPDPIRNTDLAIRVSALRFAPDGSAVVTGSRDGTVAWWDLSGLSNLRDHAAERACMITRDGFDPGEWYRYLPGLPYQETCPLDGG